MDAKRLRGATAADSGVEPIGYGHQLFRYRRRFQSHGKEYYDHKLGRRNSQLDREQDPAVAYSLGRRGNRAV